ncbi:MAG TPA: VCBS repeat-containing protein [Chitinophagaceae bacterium]|nr:VCBS repeat-containing protein [Chitinophagaceae bacterium]
MMIYRGPNTHLVIACIYISTLLIACNSRKTLFTEVSSSKSTISFINKPEKNDHLNILYYLYYYNGGGVSVGDINNDGLTDIYFTANSKGHNKLYLNTGNFVFEDITDKAAVAGSSDWCSGVTMADVNGDGFLDIYVSAVANYLGLKGHNELFINNGNNTFTESSSKYGLDLIGLSTQAAFFDYDHDGDLDCYILRHSKKPHANIADTSHRLIKDSISGDRFFRNDLSTSGKFTNVSDEVGIYQSSLGYGLGLAVADINSDGWDDVYVGNDFHENDYYYINNGNGTFTESGAKHFRHYSRFSMGNDVADYNNDGQLDVITVDMLPPDEKTLKTYGSDENPDIYKQKLEINGFQFQFSKNCLQRNNGNGNSFSEVALMNNVAATDWSWAPLFADFDNDGIKDLFISSGIVKRPVDLDYVRFVSDMEMKGLSQTNKYDDKVIDAMPDGSSHPFLFKGKGDKPFADVSKDWGFDKLKGFYNGSAYADLDNDGDLDLVINCINSKALVFKNNTKKKNSLTISFKGDSMNTFGIGVKACLFNKGKMQYQQLMLTRGFQSSVDTRLHFGLDSLNTLDSILVVWPDQKFEVLKNAPANKSLIVYKKNSSGVFDYVSWFKPLKDEFIVANISAPWKHNENDFFDYNVQYLIPHAESTRGPKIAVADVNADGLDDMYACGAKDQAGALLIQQSNGSFMKSDTATFNTDAICEDVDAVFFDANGDKKVDLFVVSGGNEPATNNHAYDDRLYLNDGKGHFAKAIDHFKAQSENKSCVAVADIDNDGDNDLFVGNLASPTAYGIPRTSYLYINDGNANFILADSNKINLNSIGMVTSAAFTDLNNDGWQDLVVTGEWMAVKIFMNNKGIFTAKDISQSTGLWQTIFPVDVNGDGFMDLLAGNWGHNTKLYSGKNGPCKLYTNDFDKNGAIEQLMCYTIDGNEYPFLAKDELERRVPVLKKYYLKYKDVAGKTIQYIFYDLFKNYTELKAEVLSSSCFINDGKGNFTRIDLPDELQLAPVMSFTKAAEPGSFIAGGNFYGTIPYEGRYDALLPTEFSFNSQTRSFETGFTIQNSDGEIRDIKWITAGSNKKLLLFARNNKELIFLKNKKGDLSKIKK